MPPISPRRFGNLATIVLTFALAMGALDVARGDDKPPVTVYKSPTCGCCQAWVDYLEDNGFTVVTHNLTSLGQLKASLGLTDRRLHSCHTATIGDYVVEGHVPVADIEQLLKDKPDILGLTAPGMPMLSPGMNSLEPKNYDVLSVTRTGEVSVFSRY